MRAVPHAKTNTEFWKAKIERNRERDKNIIKRLAEMRWHSITIWECQLRPSVRQQTFESLEYTLSCIYLADHTHKRYTMPEGEIMMAAEDNPQFLSHEGNINDDVL